MRELKFRAFHKERKTMSYDITLSLLNREREFMLANPTDEYEWMQFTGVNDKNGKGIYEGDVRVNGDVVVYSESWTKFGWTDGGYILDITKEDEIIGNIHENPEFIK